MNINDYLSEVKNIFDNFNELLFDNQLPEAILIIQNSGNKKGLLGWCSAKPSWQTKDGSEQKYEITVTAEHLHRSIEDIAATILHEMCHFNNALNGVVDCTGPGKIKFYHNKHFKKEAEERGLVVEKTVKNGWAYTYMGTKAKEAFDKINIDISAFDFARIQYDKPEKEQIS